MLPGLSRVGFLLASASAVAGPTYTVGISNETISKVNTDGTAATASFTFRTDRSVRDQDGAILDSAWVSSGATVGNYSIRVTVNSGSTPSGTIGSWLALSSNRTWSLTDAAGAAGTKTCSLKVEIKDNASGVILDTATYTMTADSQAAGSGTTYSPAAGTYSANDNAGYGEASYTVSASASVVWTWSATSTIGLTASLASGGSGTSINFDLVGGLHLDRSTTITLTSGGKTWTISLSASATAPLTGTTCVVVDTPVWVAPDPTNSGVIEVPAGDIVAGDYVYTPHEITLEWDNFEVLSNEIVDDKNVLAVVLEGRRLRATPEHKFYIDGKWQTITELGGVPDGKASVVRMRVKGAKTYTHPPAEPGGKPVTSHNIKN